MQQRCVKISNLCSIPKRYSPAPSECLIIQLLFGLKLYLVSNCSSLNSQLQEERGGKNQVLIACTCHFCTKMLPNLWQPINE